ncbi:MAG: hypothetical protein O7D91_17680 [Planctomycetota bacterium]|nr:hypothetical protein [Planctomycetota bacterium]
MILRQLVRMMRMDRAKIERFEAIERAAKEVAKYAVPVPGDDGLHHLQSRWIVYLCRSLEDSK